MGKHLLFSLSIAVFGAGLAAGLGAGLTSCCPAEDEKPPVVPVATATPPPQAEQKPQPPPPPLAPAADVPSGEDAARDEVLARTATAIVDAFSNSGAVLSPDGKKVVFDSNRDGLPQVYLGDVATPKGPAVRLTQTGERTVSPQFTQDGQAVVFVSDKGADENFAIYRIDQDGRNQVNLTPGESLHRDPPYLPDQAPGMMFYSARNTKDPVTRVYAQQTTPGSAPKQVYLDPLPGGLAAVSRDGKWGLMIESKSLSESTLTLIDLASGTPNGTGRRLYPAEGQSVNVYAVAFSADGQRAFVSTDGGGEDALVLLLDLPTGQEKARYVETKPKTANIEDLVASPSGDVLAAMVDGGNHKEVRLLDQKTLKQRVPLKLSLGSGGLGRFTNDGKRLTLTWSAPKVPADVYVVEAASGKVGSLRDEPRPTLSSLPPLDAQIAEVPSFDGTKIPVNLYLPPRRGPRKPMATIVLVHGGPAASSSIAWNPWARFYSSQGYAVVEPNVRGSTGFGRAYEMADNGHKRLDAVRDVEEVGRWVAKQPWADKNKLVIMGGSYGGYMTLMALTHQPDLWRAGIDLVGPSNMRTFLASTTGEIRAVFATEFGSLDKEGEFLDSISPIKDIDKIVAPLFVYQGSNDPRVPKPEADQIVRVLRERKVPVEYMVAPNEGHSLAHKETQIGFLSRTARFLEKQLGTPARTP